MFKKVGVTFAKAVGNLAAVLMKSLKELWKRAQTLVLQ